MCWHIVVVIAVVSLYRMEFLVEIRFYDHFVDTMANVSSHSNRFVFAQIKRDFRAKGLFQKRSRSIFEALLKCPKHLFDYYQNDIHTKPRSMNARWIEHRSAIRFVIVISSERRRQIIRCPFRLNNNNTFRCNSVRRSSLTQKIWLANGKQFLISWLGGKAKDNREFVGQ